MKTCFFAKWIDTTLHLHLEDILMYRVFFNLFLTFSLLGLKKVFKKT